MARYRIIHCVNQFFGGLGGEEKAGTAPELFSGPRGPGNLLQTLFPDVQITATLVVGDNYLVENTEAALGQILDLLTPLFSLPDNERPHFLLAGPAFNAGRYGLSCGAICKAVVQRFQVPVATAMYPDNPAVIEYKKEIFIARAARDVMGMPEALRRMVNLGLKLWRGEQVLPERDEYIPQGRRCNFFAEQNGATRAVDLLLRKIKGEPYVTEYPMPIFDRVAPARAITDLSKVKLALVTSGGIVPRGNPDRIEAANASHFGVYPLNDLSPATHQTAHGGYDPTFANEDPNRVLPLDAVRELQTEKVFAELHPYYYATVGNATSVANARKFGREIAAKLVADGVRAVILTST